MSASRSQDSFVRLVDWRTVLAAGVPVWALVGGLIAWQKFAPKPTAVARPVVTNPSPLPPLIEQLPPPRTEIPVNPFNTPTTVAVKRTEPKPVEIDPEVAEVFRQATKELVRGFLTARSAEPVAMVKAENKAVPAGCQTFDTALHFVKHYDEAKRQATKQDKLVFVLHLSGNLDDDGFT